jgi:hypothetical protein
MSATTRTKQGGPATERHEGDYYRTPAWCVRAIFPWLPPGGMNFRVVDAGAGDGAISLALTAQGASYCRENMVCVETNLDRAAQCRAYRFRTHEMDFLAFDAGGIDAIVMNPPFDNAIAFVQHAIECTPRPVFALLRLPWLASRSRADFHRAHPAHILVLPRRPSFTADGKTDATDYAWFAWNTSDDRGERLIEPGRWDVLDVEPKEPRR